MKLTEKLSYEYKCFYLDQMRTSRENIFARSHEIESKKLIKKAMDDLVDVIDPETEEYLLAQDNILESAYRFLEDERKGETESCEQTLRRWFLFLRSS